MRERGCGFNLARLAPRSVAHRYRAIGSQKKAHTAIAVCAVQGPTSGRSLEAYPVCRPAGDALVVDESVKLVVVVEVVAVELDELVVPPALPFILHERVDEVFRRRVRHDELSQGVCLYLPGSVGDAGEEFRLGVPYSADARGPTLQRAVELVIHEQGGGVLRRVVARVGVVDVCR